jgi:hypothetical protein
MKLYTLLFELDLKMFLNSKDSVAGMDKRISYWFRWEN